MTTSTVVPLFIRRPPLAPPPPSSAAPPPRSAVGPAPGPIPGRTDRAIGSARHSSRPASARGPGGAWWGSWGDDLDSFHVGGFNLQRLRPGPRLVSDDPVQAGQ